MHPRRLQPKGLLLATTLALALMSTWSCQAETIAEHEAARGGEANPQHEQQVTEAPAKSQGPPLIDFSTYTSLFNKSYSSWRQSLVRHQLFTVKKVQVFMTAAKYRLNNYGYYLVINQYSDMTPEEERRKMSGDGGDLPSDDEDDDDGPMNDEHAKQLLLAELEDQRAEKARGLEVAHSDKRRPDSEKMAATTAAKSKEQRDKRRQGRQRAKRDANAGEESPTPRKDLSLADLVRLPKQDTGAQRVALNIKWVVPSNNPDYTPMESVSFGETPDVHEKLDDVPEDQIERIEKSTSSWLSIPTPSVVNFISDSAKSTYTWLRSKSFNWSGQPATQVDKLAGEDEVRRLDKPSESFEKHLDAAKPVRGDLVIKDWRESGCIAPPIQQGSCQSCYAVSSTAFIEWAFCMNQDRVLTPLSAQYLVSCGSQFKGEADPKLKIEFYGCGRGRSRQAMYFVKDYGAELEANMPYLGRDTPCPIEPGTPLKHKGYIRPNVKQSVRMAANTKQLELALKVGPVIVNFREPVDFMAYGGGMVGRCYQRGGHAMLVVGHGVENNKPYLIIKNSFGTSWGMHGYFKFDRKYTEECVKDFILPRVSFPSKKSQARHVKAYLAGRAPTEPHGESSQDSVLSNLDKIFDVDTGGLLYS